MRWFLAIIVILVVALALQAGLVAYAGYRVRILIRGREAERESQRKREIERKLGREK